MNTGPKLEEKVPLVLVDRPIDDSKLSATILRLASSHGNSPTKSTATASYLQLTLYRGTSAVLSPGFCQRPISGLFVERRRLPQKILTRGILMRNLRLGR